MKRKHFIKFLNNAAHYNVDLEFVDVIQTTVASGKMKTDKTEFLFDHVDQGKHGKLAKRTNSDNSRTIAANHLKAQIRIGFIKSIYEAATIYFQDILKAATRKGVNTERLLADHSKAFTCREIIEIGSYPRLMDAIASSIFRSLENEKSTKSLIEKMIKRLGLTLENSLITETLPYFELRHLLVHNEGKADAKFWKAFPTIVAEPDKNVRLSFKLVSEARMAITALITEFDEQVVANNLVQPAELQP